MQNDLLQKYSALKAKVYSIYNVSKNADTLSYIITHNGRFVKQKPKQLHLITLLLIVYHTVSGIAFVNI